MNSVNSRYNVINDKSQGRLNWASIVILWVGIILCIESGMIGNLKVIIATVLLSATTAITYINFKKGAKTTMFVILVGAIRYIQFFPFKYEASFGIRDSGIELGLEFVMIAVAILHYYTNRDFLIEPEKSISEEEKKAQFNESKRLFKKRFSSRDITELKRLVEEGKIIAPAISAAKELIEEKENRKAR